MVTVSLDNDNTVPLYYFLHQVFLPNKKKRSFNLYQKACLTTASKINNSAYRLDLRHCAINDSLYPCCSLKGMTGGMLRELCILSFQHPETFYNVISKTAGIDVVGILQLSSAIKSLAPNNQK